MGRVQAHSMGGIERRYCLYSGECRVTRWRWRRVKLNVNFLEEGSMPAAVYIVGLLYPEPMTIQR